MRRLTLAWVVLTVSVLPAYATPVLLGTESSATVGGLGVSNSQYLAQEFTLTAAVNATLLDVELQTNTRITEPFSLFLTNSLGPGETTLASSSFAFPGPIGEFTFVITLNQLLDPGMYWIVAAGGSTATSGHIGWVPDTVLSSTVGTVGSEAFTQTGLGLDSANPPASTFFPFTEGPGKAFQFQLEGTAVPSTIPEPTSVTLLGTGALSLLWRRRSRHR